jgi:hypothetical protein
MSGRPKQRGGLLVVQAAAILAWVAAFSALGTQLVRYGACLWVGNRYAEDYATVGTATAGAAVQWSSPFIALAAFVAAGAMAWCHVLPGAGRSLPGPMTGPVGTAGRLLGLAAAVMFAGCLGCLAALHLLRPELDPRSHFLSEYAVGPHGWVMTTALTLGGCASVALVAGMVLAVTPSLWLALACGGTFVAGVGYVFVGYYTIDPAPPDGARSIFLHNVCSTYSGLFATAAFLVFPLAFWDCPRWRPFVVPAAVAGVLVAAVFFRLPAGIGGIGQRLFVGSATGCGLVAAVQLARGGPRPSRIGDQDRSRTARSPERH